MASTKRTSQSKKANGSEKSDKHKGHRQRLKKRFLTEGIDSFEMHNVLELLLFYAYPRIDTNEIAHDLLNKFGSISAVFEASVDELITVPYITENVAVLITMVPYLSRVYLQDKVANGCTCQTHQQLGEYLMPKFVGCTKERVYLMCLDAHCRVLGCELLADGSIGEVALNVRKIVEIAIKYNCTDVVLAHNHPRGMSIPSKEDLLITRSIVQTLNTINIHLIDHIIVASDGFISLANHNFLQKMYDGTIYCEVPS